MILRKFKINSLKFVRFGNRTRGTLILLRMMYYSVNDTGILGKKFRVLLSGVEPKTFRLLVRMLYH